MDHETREMIADKALRMVWSHNPPHRYCPQAIGEGPGWEVWDRKDNRAVPIDELVQMTPDEVAQKLVN